jgi:hypothetical protein
LAEALKLLQSQTTETEQSNEHCGRLQSEKLTRMLVMTLDNRAALIDYVLIEVEMLIAALS